MSAENAITSAQNRVQAASLNVQKLTITAPFSGQVSDISVDIGQQVSPGASIARVTSGQASVQIQVTDSVADQLQLQDTVRVVYKGVDYEGVVTSVARIANASLLHVVDISVPDVDEVFGAFADVHIAIASDAWMLPVSSVEILSEQSGRVAIWGPEGVVWIPVQLGRIQSTSVEVLAGLTSDMNMILTDMENFDPNIMIPTLAN